MRNRFPARSATPEVLADSIASILPAALLAVSDGLVVRTLAKGRRQPVPDGQRPEARPPPEVQEPSPPVRQDGTEVFLYSCRQDGQQPSCRPRIRSREGSGKESIHMSSMAHRS
jgi:hypothetical protein